MKQKLKRNQFPDFVGKLSKAMCIMKLTLFLILLNVCAAFSNTYSQQTKFTLSGENVSIRDVLTNIESKSEFRFFFNSSLINLDQRVNYHIEEGTILDLLNQVLSKNGIQYEVKDRTIILSPKPSNGQNIAFQQQHAVYGKVTDSSGAPLPGVSIVIKGTTQGIITDADGKYSLTNVPGDATLVFSFVGMRSQEIAVSGKTTINVMMQEENVGIEEVVAIGYGTQKKVNLIGSVSTIQAQELESRSATNLSSALTGLSSGVYVYQGSGNPGEDGATIRIRGLGTLNSNAALVVVDGIPGSLDAINPEDVESISILKDAAAASIYGSRASNGVILVTTKKGKKDKVSVTYSGSVSLNLAQPVAQICDQLCPAYGIDQ